mmetsp:Transcript_51311/g.69880  ORF Transcript_51311/g.69880 Transcript_51311/m.69880 type:complete len:698 (-) Transcript_51311:644-2737(-)
MEESDGGSHTVARRVTDLPTVYEREGYQSERIELLRHASVLDTLPEKTFEQITMLAQDIFSVPVALVSLVDEHRQYFKSNRGLSEVRETPRSQAFCDFLVKSNKNELFVVEDATKNEPFKSNPLVTGWPHIRFYAGAPIRVKSPKTGRFYVLGTLCIIDCSAEYFSGDVEYTPRDSLNEIDESMLLTLGSLITNVMQQRINSLQEMAKQRLMYVSCTAHDIRSPLMSFNLALDLLKQSSLSEEQDEIVSSAVAATECMHVAVDKAIEVARSASGGKAVMPMLAPISVRDISERVQRLASSSSRQNVPVSFEVDSAVPQLIYADSVLIWRIATNFLTNAIRHTATGDIQCRFSMATPDEIPSAKVVEQCRSQAFPQMMIVEEDADAIFGWLHIECRDTGEGVPVAERENVFNIFYQGGKPLEGAGLGLFAVLQCSALLCGACGVRDNPSDEDGKPSAGVCFWACFPVKHPPASSQETAHTCCGAGKEGVFKMLHQKATAIMRRGSRDAEKFERELKRSREEAAQNDETEGSEHTTKRTKPGMAGGTDKAEARTYRVLVIEDSTTIRKLLCKSLRLVGCETDQAEDGQQGLQALQKCHYDLVLVDFMMPIMDGINCVKQFRSWEGENRRHELRQLIIGISANGNDEDVNRGLQAGMDFFEPKPVSPEKLRKLLGREGATTRDLADLYPRLKKQRGCSRE